MTRKIAVLIHSYGGSVKDWYTKDAPIIKILERDGYEVLTPDLHADFRFWNTDFRKKSIQRQAHIIGTRLCEENDILPIDELMLLGYGVGGLIARYFVKRVGVTPTLPNEDAACYAQLNSKISRVITIATPNHGTMPHWHDMANVAYFSETAWAKDPIFLDLAPGSDFLMYLNTPTETKPGIDWYSIWCRGDLLSTPAVTAVLHGARNFCIESSRVNHQNILWRSETRDIVRAILQGNDEPVGLQDYPPIEHCEAGRYHAWFPDRGSRMDFRWHCKNVHKQKKCTKVLYSRWWPHNRGCEVGKMDQDMYQHTWRKTGITNYICVKCNRRKLKYSHRPRKKDSPTCNVFPFPRYHRWHIQQHEWECKNCGKKTWSHYRPAILGCAKGKIDVRLHSWVRGEMQEHFYFKCYSTKGGDSCTKTAWWPPLRE